MDEARGAPHRAHRAERDEPEHRGALAPSHRERHRQLRDEEERDEEDEGREERKRHRRRLAARARDGRRRRDRGRGHERRRREGLQMVEQSAVAVARAVPAVLEVERDAPVPLLPLHAQVPRQPVGVEVPHPRSPVEAQAPPRLEHAEGEFGVLSLQIALVEAVERGERVAAVEDVEGREEVDLALHARVPHHDLLVDEALEERRVGRDRVAAADAADRRVVEMRQEEFERVGTRDAVAVDEPDETGGRRAPALVARGARAASAAREDLDSTRGGGLARRVARAVVDEDDARERRARTRGDRERGVETGADRARRIARGDHERDARLVGIAHPGGWRVLSLHRAIPPPRAISPHLRARATRRAPRDRHRPRRGSAPAGSACFRG